MTLADALARAAELMPGRVKWEPESGEYAIWADYGKYLGMKNTCLWLHPDGVPTPMELAALRTTLEQECEARGLYISQHTTPDGPVCEITGIEQGFAADTPAHALLLALIAAVEASTP